MSNDLKKSLLALGWHLVDGLLDAYDAPKGARLAWAGVGLVWAASWLGYYGYRRRGGTYRRWQLVQAAERWGAKHGS